MQRRIQPAANARARHVILAAIVACLLTATSSAQAFDFERLDTTASGVSSYPYAIGDVNGDGAPDLVQMPIDQLSIRLHLNLGDGTFGPSTNPAAVSAPFKLASSFGLKDIDADGDLDLQYIFGNYTVSGTLGTIVIAKNDGTGVFTTSSSITSPAVWPSGVFVADFDHDNDVDFIVTHHSYSSLIYLMRNDGTGAFTSTPTSVVGGSVGPYYQIVDLDADGDPDMFTDNGDGIEMGLVNDGTGTFSFGPAGLHFGSLMGSQFHDLDADGDLDALRFYNFSVLAFRANQGGLVFGPWTPIPGTSMESYSSFAAGDFDADGRADLIIDPLTIPGSPRVFRNLGGLTFAQTSGTSNVGSLFARATTDFDRDGDVDALMLDQLTGKSTILRNARLAGASFCFGDGSSGTCPCGNPSPVGAHAGCRNSLGTVATLCGAGAARLSNDTLLLQGAQMPDSPVLYFQGTTAIGGIVFGDGLRCAAGALTRLAVRFNVSGASTIGGAGQPSISSLGFVTAAGTRTYQSYYRDSLSFCTGLGFNLTNAVSILWVP